VKKILAPINYYLPSYKAGGPIHSLSNIIGELDTEFVFKIITRDRDLGDRTSFSNIKSDTWTKINKTEIYYISPNKLKISLILKLLRSIDYDILYLNSFFCFSFSILFVILLKLRLIHKSKVVIAPRGEFSPAALSIKSLKKKIYISLSKILGLYPQSFIWQASSAFEKEDIYAVFGTKCKVIIAPDLAPKLNSFNQVVPVTNIKKKGELKLVFLSRISQIKNLEGTLNILDSLSLNGKMSFDIFGPIEDEIYWDQCLSLVNKLNKEKKINVCYCGPISNELVRITFSKYHLFFLPTKGENFGYAILEALSAGCPVLISDKTPWVNLRNKGVGWDVPLNDFKAYREVITDVLNMDESVYRPWSKRAREYALAFSQNKEYIDMTRALFL